MTTNVPSRGWLRRIGSAARRDGRVLHPPASRQLRAQYQFKSREDTSDSFSHMAARHGRTANVINIFVEFKRSTACLAPKLSAPFRAANLSAVTFAIFKNLDLAHCPFGRKSYDILDQLMFAKDLIGEEHAVEA